MKQTFTCPVALALDVLGGKWRAVILARWSPEHDSPSPEAHPHAGAETTLD